MAIKFETYLDHPKLKTDNYLTNHSLSMETRLEHLTTINKTIDQILTKRVLTASQVNQAKTLTQNNACTLLMQTSSEVTIEVENVSEPNIIVKLCKDDEFIFPVENDKSKGWTVNSFAALLTYREQKDWFQPKLTGLKFTRSGMRKRVLKERMEKAQKAAYRVELANNIHGEHILYNEKGIAYRITLRDFDHKIGYIDNVDWKFNKLGTTKHIMYLFNYLESAPHLLENLKTEYPFVEIYLDPLNDYRISWYYPNKLDKETGQFLRRYFGRRQYIEDSKIPVFASFLNEVIRFPEIKVRAEVSEKIERYFNEVMLEKLEKTYLPDYSPLKANLYPYQKEGVKFALFKTGAIIADEMGLGKTLQAIAIATLKKDLFGFAKNLIVCPASLKAQWKTEIEKFTDCKAIVVDGFPEDRKVKYWSNDYDFFIINYETVLRDLSTINKVKFDFLILDEAQKIKNYQTKTSSAIKKIWKRHCLVLTGTPIENKLIDLYSITQVVDPHFLAPLWEFSYQHCLFDPNSNRDKIVGYYNLNQLKKRMSKILIRREKRSVINQLPNVQQLDVPIVLHDAQAEMHAGFASGVAYILGKKYKTPYDWQRLMLLLNNMRMVCNSTFLIDKETNHSPKLYELKHLLLEKLDIQNNKRKIIIFSEWINMLNLIAEVLEELQLGFVMLTGKVPVRKRGQIVKQFESDKKCRVFLSTESGGAGLNLQVADTVINFELPWNPAKKNQRIGRIDRLGQKSETLNVINLITVNSIEQKIADGLILKQNLFEGVLSPENIIDEVDFSNKGKAQFIKELEAMLGSFNDETSSNIERESVIGEGAIEHKTQQEISLDEEAEELGAFPEIISSSEANQESVSTNVKSEMKNKTEQLEQVLNQGMGFLAGIYKMTTGQDLQADGSQKIEVNPETGEVVMRFKVKL